MKNIAVKSLMALLAILLIGMGTWGADAYAEEQDAATSAPPPTGGHGPHFVDADGDGYNDLAPDHDGDGIPNGQDPDWVKGAGGDQNRWNHHGRHNGSCPQCGNGSRGGRHGIRGFVDEDGDGFNDLAPDHDGDGIPNGRDPDFKKGAGMGRQSGNAQAGQGSNGNGRQDDGDQGNSNGGGNSGGGRGGKK